MSRIHLKNSFEGESERISSRGLCRRGDSYQRYDEPRERGRAEIRRLQPKCIFEMGSIHGKNKKMREGITLLLVIILLSAIMSISLGIFNIVLGELRISGQISDSFVAFYAADQGIERMLYLDRNLQTICQAPGPDCFTDTDVSVESGGCYTGRVSKAGNTTDIVVAGQYRCGPNPARVVKRGFEVTY